MRAHQGTFLRTQKTWEAYKNAPKRGAASCFLCEGEDLDIVEEHAHWFICKNQYPYDAVAKVHHMLVPKLHVPRAELLTTPLRDELMVIQYGIETSDKYDCILTNYPGAQSHPPHLHYHLIKWKRHNN